MRSFRLGFAATMARQASEVAMSSTMISVQVALILVSHAGCRVASIPKANSPDSDPQTQVKFGPSDARAVGSEPTITPSMNAQRSITWKLEVQNNATGEIRHYSVSRDGVTRVQIAVPTWACAAQPVTPMTDGTGEYGEIVCTELTSDNRVWIRSSTGCMYARNGSNGPTGAVLNVGAGPVGANTSTMITLSCE
jgi:hypothetical protein